MGDDEKDFLQTVTVSGTGQFNGLPTGPGQIVYFHEPSGKLKYPVDLEAALPDPDQVETSNGSLEHYYDVPEMERRRRVASTESTPPDWLAVGDLVWRAWETELPPRRITEIEWNPSQEYWQLRREGDSWHDGLYVQDVETLADRMTRFNWLLGQALRQHASVADGDDDNSAVE